MKQTKPFTEKNDTEEHAEKGVDKISEACLNDETGVDGPDGCKPVDRYGACRCSIDRLYGWSQNSRTEDLPLT